jgi:hypothetical protein
MPRSKTAEFDENESPAHVCVVYDPKTGRVAHVHEFYGKGFKADECERQALDTVASLGRVKTAGLKVLHPTELKYEPDTMLRLNTKSLEIVAKKRLGRRPAKTTK